MHPAEDRKARHGVAALAQLRIVREEADEFRPHVRAVADFRGNGYAQIAGADHQDAIPEERQR